MIAKWQWLILKLTRTLWIRAALFSVLALVTALAAAFLEPYIPSDLPTKIGANAVDSILNILATSMLAVTTFSLTVMVSAYSAATNTTTPRATRLLIQDGTTQNVLSTFLGAFLFSLVGIVALSTGVYGQQGRLILFVVSVLVIVLIVLTMLRWIEHLTQFGRVSDTTQRVERVTEKSLLLRTENPYLGAQPLLHEQATIPVAALAVYADSVGYIQHIDVEKLSTLATQNKLSIFVTAQPGSFVHAVYPLVWLEGAADDDVISTIRSAFSVDAERSFDQDPRFGLCVLGEIASRALSPAVNDAGTAIDVVGRAVRLLTQANDNDHQDPEVTYPNIWIAPVFIDDLFDDIFLPVVRDGAGYIEVQVRLQKAFFALAALNPAKYSQAAFRLSTIAVKHASKGLPLHTERAQMRKLAAEVTALHKSVIEAGRPFL